jgi:type IV pilus assembly protein PilW
MKFMSANRERGFSLVELLVAMAISLIAIIAMTQIFAGSEGQRRTSGAGVDAQTAAAVGLYSIERDVAMAGYAINNASIRSCANFYSYHDSDGNGPLPGAPVPNLSSSYPIRIIDGGLGGSDTIVLTSGSTSSSGMPTQLADNMPAAQDDIEVNNISGCVKGGFAIITDGSNCTFLQITDIDALAFKLKHEYKDTTDPTYNPPIAYLAANSWPKYSIGNTAVCLSNSLQSRIYSVTNNRLTLGIIDIAPDIVSLQAQYGISATGTSDVVVNWVNATNTGGTNWADPSPADRERIKAVRIGIVARSAQPEREAVTGSCTTTSGVVNNGPCLWDDTAADPAPSIDLSGLPEWTRYRYKTYSTVVVPRNLMWKPPL